MKALRRFVVRAQLPEPLADLGELAANLRWSWHGPTRDLFADIDAGLWERVGGDPWRMLGEVSAARLQELPADRSYRRAVRAAADDLRNYLSRPGWFADQTDGPRGIAYFSMEYGLTAALPNYSGGLGILAGDHLKAASDLGLPLVGVGLLYRGGYFQQSLTADGWQAESYVDLDPRMLPLRPLLEGGHPVLVHVPMSDNRVLRARVWIAAVGRIPLLLLDSDVAENDPPLRAVTDRLYGGDQQHRIEQEILAGIGGVRAVRAYTRCAGLPDPDVFHSNEGHASFSGIERVREYLAAGMDFDAAVAAVRAGTVFTTHTPVPAGIDRFPAALVRRYLGSEHDAESTLLPGVGVDRILALGRETDPSVFNMAHLGLRLAQRANAVSTLHGRISRSMFAPLWPGFDDAEVPIGSVTNGVHAATWLAREWLERLGEFGGPEALGPGRGWEGLGEVTAPRLWATRTALRAELVAHVRRRLRASWLERGAAPAELGWVDEVFDPHVLTLGFARRVSTYKRVTLMMRDPQRLRELLLDPDRPLQVVVAGKSHPADDGAKALVQQVVRFADDPAVRHRIVFLPDYDMALAQCLAAGCDVWLNNPLRPMEACGTSGMKVALNGGLNVSVRDGWWDEYYDGGNGWAIPTADGVRDEPRRDDLEAAALYDLLQRSVLPRFYDDRDADGVPVRWLAMVRHTLRTLGPRVLASRMVRDYTLGYYCPAAAAVRAVSCDDFAGAREVAQYRRRVAAAWAQVSVVRVDSTGLPETPAIGAQLQLRARVELGGLTPEDVLVEAVLGRVVDRDELSQPVTVQMAHEGSEGEIEVFGVQTQLPLSGVVGYTVRVLPRHSLLASPAELGLVATARP